MMLLSKRMIPVFLLALFVILTACGGGSTVNVNEGNANQGGSQGTSQQKQVIDINVGAGHTAEGATWIRLIRDFFIPEVDKRLEGTNYQIKWEQLYGGTVAKLGEELEAIESGTLDMGFIVSPFEPAKLLITNIGYNTPFSSPDPGVIHNVAQKLLEKYPQFVQEYEDNNLKLLGLGYTESYELLTTFPVNKVDDLKGVKVAAAGPNLEWIKPVGAVPVQSGLNEAYTSFQSGVYDGWVMYSGSTVGFKLYEVAPYFTKVGFGSVIVGALTMNKDVWEGLPDEVKAVFEEVGKLYSEEMVKVLQNETESNLKFMQENGSTISDFPTEEKKKWLEMMPNQPNNYAKQLNEAGLPGTEIMTDYIQGQTEQGYLFPLEYTIE